MGWLLGCHAGQPRLFHYILIIRNRSLVKGREGPGGEEMGQSNTHSADFPEKCSMMSYVEWWLLKSIMTKNGES